MKKILITDDARLMRNIIRDSIAAAFADYEILEAGNGEEAVQTYMEHHPDLVTMDVTMDIMNGIDAAKTILSRDPCAKIIMVTAMGQEKMLEECISAGVLDYIVKPFTGARIAAAVYKALQHEIGAPVNA
ncbi:response regulator [bacterium]|nr:response regulator [bacterium]